MGTPLLGIALAGCAQPRLPGALAPRPAPPGVISYLALGDSYTIGEGVAPSDRWPNQLAHAMRAQGDAVTDPRIIASTGWTTDELSAAVDAADARAPLGNYGLVTLAIGVNNQYRGRDVDNYRVELTALLDRAIGFAGGNPQHVLMLSIPDWGVTPFARAELRSPRRIARELDTFNATAREICIAHDVSFVDITEVSRELGAQPAMLVDDGLHPSAAMHAQWTRLALSVVRRRLQR